MQFLGQTYGELHKIDTMITGSSQHLQQRSGAFKEVVNDILTNQVPVANQQSHVVSHHPVVSRVTTAHIEPTSVVQHDPNQMEFTFFKPEDVRSVSNTLARLEDKIDRIDKKLSKLLDGKQK